MFTSAELIQALQRRLRRSIRPQPPAGELPPGWQSWLDAMPARTGRITGATREAIASVLAGRAPVFTRGYERLNTAQALVRLWRYDWRVGDRGDRRARRAAMLLTLLFHVLWVAALMVLMFARFAAPLPADERVGEENVVQVEFIGDGTPEEEAGGAPPARDAQVEAPTAARQPPAAPAAATAAPPALPALAPPEVVTPPRTPQLEVPAHQPLQVTETTTPDSTFLVPPVQLDGLRAPDVLPRPPAAVREPVVRSVAAPAVAPSLQPLQPRDTPVPATPTPDLRAEIRDVPAPPAPSELREIAAPAVAAPVVRAERATATRSLPTPSPAVPAGEPSERDVSPASSAAASGGRVATTAAPATGQGTRPAAPAAGSGVAAAPAAGASPTPRRGDDWGEALRNRPGGTGGLFNADGSPRLAGAGGTVGGGLPPGTITEDYEKIDRMGTWLKRPPTDYEPTSLDRFWVPQETLLQEWVRRSIKEVLIPIPGTGKSLRCAVALLALGGACGIFDPNMRDVEAVARPPPDVPFKPELYEDPDSLAKPPADG